jgi:omega-6 fatty acid desaturase (delta-12 desaturase)
MSESRPLLTAHDGHAVIRASRAFAVSDRRRAAWQVGSTLAVFGGLLWLAAAAGPGLLGLLLIPLVAGLIVRIFVLQHDCGHRSLLPTQRENYVVGGLLSFITTIPFGPWRDEHQWHHTHQGQLSRRGVDSMNSPMTVGEVPDRLAEATVRVQKVRPYTVFLLGAYSLMVRRKRIQGFFPYRPNFMDRPPDRAVAVRSVGITILGSLLMQGALVAAAGWWVWAAVYLPALAVGAGIGSLLFWVQHNFEHTYYEKDEQWSAANVALFGSSYLRLGGILGWVTGHIGLHHVHHLNPRIPNYALERARVGIPALAAVQPLDREALRRSFTHLFWDPSVGRMRPAAEVEALSPPR